MSRASMWRWPIVLGALSLVGLVWALVSDGAGDVASWLLLGLPVAVGAWFGWLRAKFRSPASPSRRTP